MSVPVNSILSLDLRLLLVNKLQKSLTSQYGISLQQAHPNHLDKLAVNLSHFWPSLFQDIPLNRIHSENQLEYVSAIAFKLSKLLHQPASKLAEQIVIQINQESEVNHTNTVPGPNTVPEQIWQNFWQNWIALAVEPGWIRLRLTEQGLAEWLQHLLHAPLTWEPEEMLHNTQIVEIDPDSPHFFTVLHTHARCCALLCRAHEGNLIQLATSTSQVSTAITIAGALPWLTDTDISLRFQQDQEWNLIGQISDTLSYLSLSETDLKANPPATKVAYDLSRAFQTFYAACPIWGEAKQNLALAQAQLGLVSITQRMLDWLLKTKLGQIAPTNF